MTQRKRGRWRGLHAALAVVLGAGMALTPVTPAAAACWADGCNGLDPNVHCSASATPAQKQVGSYIVQIRYSSGCNSFWGRATQDCYHSPPAYVRIERWIWTTYGYYRQYAYISGQLPCGGNPGWSPMVGAHASSKYRACIAAVHTSAHPSTFPESYWSTCTNWIVDRFGSPP